MKKDIERNKIKFLNCPPKLESKKKEIAESVQEFLNEFNLLEEDTIYILTDLCTNSFFIECHIAAKDIVGKGTIDVPLDPENQPEYRANREVVETHSAYEKMRDDALNKRTFSNIVCEYTRTFEAEKPLKVIGGQHRYLAVKEALEKLVNEYHGIKLYFGLNTEQRLDVQLISNTNIAVSADLLDRMFETFKGPHLRNWCQKIGLLEINEDFADKKQRGSQISVRAARTFILNYYKGKSIDANKFADSETIPVLAKTGVDIDEDWEKIRNSEPDLWENKKLLTAGKKIAELNKKQQEYFYTKKENFEYADKAISYAVLAAWAFIAGVLENNPTRLQRHYNLSNITSTDPLNALALAKGRHKTDPQNYRGLGTRTDSKERGRLTELFFLQAEKGGGINKALVDVAIKKYHAKMALLEVVEAERNI